jgi:hypothetical protein
MFSVGVEWIYLADRNQWSGLLRIKFEHRIQEKRSNSLSSWKTVIFSRTRLVMESGHNFKNAIKFCIKVYQTNTSVYALVDD